MMKDGFDAVQDVRSLLNVPILTDSITGGIWPFSRPNNSDKIDIVIGLLTLSNEPFQDGVINIRGYCPNIEITGLPNLRVFDNLAKIIIPLVDTQYKTSFSTYVIEPGSIFRDTDGSHFMLIQINYNAYNEDFNNI